MKKIAVLLLLLLACVTISAQNLQDKYHSTVGYVKSDGTVQDRYHSTVGYIKSDGTVQDKYHSTIGYVKSDGTVQDRYHSTIGYAKGIPIRWAALYFFFFQD